MGLLGFAPDAIVVDDEADWDRIPRRKRMALITQSTQPPWKFERLAAFMVGRAHELKIVNSVCPVTIRRQEDTVELARAVDFIVVVGGRQSANTKELTRLCEIVGTPAIQVERAEDLADASVFDAVRVVGVTGGTSTPIEDLRGGGRADPRHGGHRRGRRSRPRARGRGAGGSRHAGRTHQLAARRRRRAAFRPRRAPDGPARSILARPAGPPRTAAAR